MTYTPFKMKGHELPGPNQRIEDLDNSVEKGQVGEEGTGKNSELIEALKKQDEADKEVENLKKETPDATGLNKML